MKSKRIFAISLSLILLVSLCFVGVRVKNAYEKNENFGQRENVGNSDLPKQTNDVINTNAPYESTDTNVDSNITGANSQGDCIKVQNYAEWKNNRKLVFDEVSLYDEQGYVLSYIYIYIQ